MPQGTSVANCVRDLKKRQGGSATSPANVYAICQKATGESYQSGRKLSERFKRIERFCGGVGGKPGPCPGDHIQSTTALHNSMAGGSKAHGGTAAMNRKIDEHMFNLAKLPKARIAQAWHQGLGGVQKFPSKEAYLKAIRQRIAGRAGAADRVNASESFSEGARVSGASVFQTGIHKGKPYDHRQLDRVVSNFKKFSSGRKPLLRVPLVVGHEEDQSYLENSGLPAAGWLTDVRNVKRVCERCKGSGRLDGKPCEGCAGSGTASTLKADFAEIPRQVKRLLDGKSYRTISAEIYPDSPEGIPGEGPMLRRIALLGGEIPAVKSLDDIPTVQEHSERSVCFPVVLRFKESFRVPKKGFTAFFQEARAMSREEMIQELTDLGFKLEEIDDAPNNTLAAILRRLRDGHGIPGEDEDEELEPDEVIDEEAEEHPPEPTRAGGGLHDVDESPELPLKDEEAKTKFAAGFKKKFPHHYTAIVKHADDANSSEHPGGLLAGGTKKEPGTQWDAAAFKENEAALKQFGIHSPEEMKAHIEGRRVRKHCDLPRQAKEGRGGGLADRFSETVKTPKGRRAQTLVETFAEEFKPFSDQQKRDFVEMVAKHYSDEEISKLEKSYRQRGRR
jgi:hypothetical protein